MNRAVEGLLQSAVDSDLMHSCAIVSSSTEETYSMRAASENSDLGKNLYPIGRKIVPSACRCALIRRNMHRFSWPEEQP